MDGIHVIAARQAVLRAAIAAVNDGSIAAGHPVADAVETLRRAEAMRPMYTCAACGRAVVVQVVDGESKTVRACPHEDATILARGVAHGVVVATVAAG